MMASTTTTTITTPLLLLAARNAGNAVRGRSSVVSMRRCDMPLLRSNAVSVSQLPPSRPPTLRLFQTLARPPVVSQPIGPVKNEEIEARMVAVVNADGKLSPPTSLQEALNQVDRRTHHLIQMSAETEEQPAVCKVISKKDLYRREKERKKQKSRAKMNQWKQLEINWGTSKNDLKQKYAKVKEIFDKGKGVEIVLLPKKRTQQATQEQAVNLLRAVKLAIIELDGKEVKPMDGVLLGDLRLFAAKASEAELAARRAAQQAMRPEREQEEQMKEDNEPSSTDTLETTTMANGEGSVEGEREGLTREPTTSSSQSI